MHAQPESNIATSFNNIHDIITRGLKVSIESARVAMKTGIKNERDREGLFNYIRALVSVVNSHHVTEDQIAFPYFLDKLPDAPFKKLTNQHLVIDTILDEIKMAADQCEKEGLQSGGWSTLENALVRMDELWHPHIKLEMETFIAKADALLPVEEQLRLVRQFSEYGQKLALPPYLTVPFMLYNLQGEGRKSFMQGMPSEVVDNLVPIVWKEKWVSMTPYLLV